MNERPEWGSSEDPEMERLLRGALRREADRLQVPDRYAQVRAKAYEAQRGRNPWLYAVAAALVLVLGAGVLWQSGLFRQFSQTTSDAAPAQDRTEAAGAPAPRATAASAASSPSASATSAGPARTATTPAQTTAAPSGPAPTAVPSTPTRTVSGAKVAFASPSGRLVCSMFGDEVVCQSMVATSWEQAAPRPCPVVSGGTIPFQYDAGSVVLRSTGASLVCGTQGMPQVDIAAKDPMTAWYDPARDTTATTPYGTAPVLPYGGVATTTGGQRCEMSEAGVFCTDPSLGMFQLSRESVLMASAAGGDRTFTRYVTSSGKAAFVSPTGRITCALTVDGASCEVTDPTYTPPAKPASCQLDWGRRISVDSTRAGFDCVGDSIRGLPADAAWSSWDDPRFGAGAQRATLAYGSTLTVGATTCSSWPTGVICTRSEGRGFTIAIGSYQIL